MCRKRNVKSENKTKTLTCDVNNQYITERCNLNNAVTLTERRVKEGEERYNCKGHKETLNYVIDESYNGKSTHYRIESVKAMLLSYLSLVGWLSTALDLTEPLSTSLGISKSLFGGLSTAFRLFSVGVRQQNIRMVRQLVQDKGY